MFISEYNFIAVGVCIFAREKDKYCKINIIAGQLSCNALYTTAWLSWLCYIWEQSLSHSGDMLGDHWITQGFLSPT